jgi:hypothetical protein
VNTRTTIINRNAGMEKLTVRPSMNRYRECTFGSSSRVPAGGLRVGQPRSGTGVSAQLLDS